MPLVAEFPQEDERLLEVLDGDRDGAGVDESEREIVERQRFCARVVQFMHDRQRCAMSLGGPLVLAFTSKLRPELVELTRLATRVGWSRLPRTDFEDVPGLMRSPARKALQALAGVEVVD